MTDKPEPQHGGAYVVNRDIEDMAKWYEIHRLGAFTILSQKHTFDPKQIEVLGTEQLGMIPLVFHKYWNQDD